MIVPSQETHYNNPTNIKPLLSSLPTINKFGDESKMGKSPLNLGFVVGIGDVQDSSTAATYRRRGVPHLLSDVEAPSISSSSAHMLLAHVAKSALSHPPKFASQGLTVTQHSSPHSVAHIMSVEKSDTSRDANHSPVNVLDHVTHALVPTITHVTTTTLSEHGLTKSPTLTVLEHSLVPVTALTTKPSHGLSKQSTVTLTPESLTKTTITVKHDQTNQDHILTTITEHAKDDLLQDSHTVVRKVSTLTHDPDPILTHDVSVTHITGGALHSLRHPLEQQNVFRTHYGGYGVGIDFGGHGSGHGFYV
jgi:hypothetical protein